MIFWRLRANLRATFLSFYVEMMITMGMTGIVYELCTSIMSCALIV